MCLSNHKDYETNRIEEGQPCFKEIFKEITTQLKQIFIHTFPKIINTLSEAVWDLLFWVKIPFLVKMVHLRDFHGLG